MVWERAVFVPAYAKINLTLEVLGRRADGFHDLASVMQTISLHDTLLLRPAPAGTYKLSCDVPALASAENLALRAAQSLDVAGGSEHGVAIELRKVIPTQGGLGGGSSDGAAVLAALAHLWDLDLADEDLLRLAAALGSDVPFLLRGGTALVGGRGERITALPDSEPLWLVVARPAVAIPTVTAFRALTPEDYADGAASDEVAAALRRGDPLPLPRLVNSFETSVRRAYPVVEETWEALHAAGAPLVRLSGSGPTLFAPFRALAPAAEVWRRLRAGGHEVWLARTVSRADVDRSRPTLSAADSSR
jgi:4-diphosphocytidyl-2-C-methyl-D-erythritol kinase